MNQQRRVEVLRVKEVVGGWRAEGVVRDQDGVEVLDRAFTYVWPDRGRGYLSVSWHDGTVAPMRSRDRSAAIRKARQAICERATEGS